MSPFDFDAAHVADERYCVGFLGGVAAARVSGVSAADEAAGAAVVLSFACCRSFLRKETIH